MFRLDGKAALVTGAGRGIGRAVARQLAALGVAVMANDIDEGPLAETAETLGRVRQHPGDITAPDVPRRLVEATIDAFGSLDIIVNNAGYTWDSVIQKSSDEQFQAMLDVHLTVPFRILRAASDWIRDAAKCEQAAGRRVMRKVVNITSIAGTGGNAGQTAYSSAKAGLVGLTKTLAKEWGRYHVNVNAVAFGLIDTRLMQPLTSDDDGIRIQDRNIRAGANPALLESLASVVPLGRRGTVEEAAGPVLFFCSPLSDYVTGEVLVCGGGLRF